MVSTSVHPSPFHCAHKSIWHVDFIQPGNGLGHSTDLKHNRSNVRSSMKIRECEEPMLFLRSKQLAFFLLLIAPTQLSGQATAPVSPTFSMPVQVQQNIPVSVQGLVSQPPGNVPGWDPNPICAGGPSGPDESTIRLDAARQVLALLMTPTDLKTLMDSEDTRFGAAASINKLNHRQSIISTLIKQFTGTHK